MKAKVKMDNVEKGKLLADLFPAELQGILDAIPRFHKTLMENEEQVRKDWDNGLVIADFWYRLATDVNQIVQTENRKLLRSRRFSDQLFDGLYALFTVDCIVKYAERERKGSNFQHMVKALFDFE